MDFVPLHFYDRKVQIPILLWHIWLISNSKAAGVWGSVMKFQSPILLIVVKYEGSILVWQFLFTQLSTFYILHFELCYRAFVLMSVFKFSDKIWNIVDRLVEKDLRICTQIYASEEGKLRRQQWTQLGSGP